MEHMAGKSAQDAPGQALAAKEPHILMLEKELEEIELRLAQMKKKLIDMKK